MKTIEVKIKGRSPLIINRFKEESELQASVKKKTKKDYGSPREQAESCAYFDKKTKKIWIPSTWVSGCLKTVASEYKLPGSRKSAKSVIGGAVFPTEEKMYFSKLLKLKDIEIDSRPVVIQSARIMRHRARLEEWEVTTVIEIDDSILPSEDVHSMLNDAGSRAGMGDFRPQKFGPFGRFKITQWKEITQKMNKKRK